MTPPPEPQKEVPVDDADDSLVGVDETNDEENAGQPIPQSSSKATSPSPKTESLLYSQQIAFLTDGFQQEHLEDHFFECPDDPRLLDAIGFSVTTQISDNQESFELLLNHSFGTVVRPAPFFAHYICALSRFDLLL